MDNMRLAFFTEDDTFPFYIQYGSHDKRLHLHGHDDFFELTIVLGGEATHLVGNERSQIKKGDVFVMGNGIMHGYEDPHDFRICNIMFRPEALLSADYDVKKLPGFHSLFLLEPLFNTPQGFQSRLTLDAEQFRTICRLIDITIAEYNAVQPGRKTLLLSYFMQIVVLLSRFYDDRSRYQQLAKTVHREIAEIAMAAAFMENHYMEALPMQRILAESHYSQRHFIRLFSSAYHMPPLKYLLGIRIRHACTLLRETDLSIMEIATMCGFEDSNYFSRIFRSNMDCSPSEYRKKTSV
jgi:AraC-like DNA-binding protein